MKSLIEQNRGVILACALETNFFKLLENAGIESIQGYLGYLLDDAEKERGIHEANFSASYLRSICIAFQYFPKDSFGDWADKLSRALCSGESEGKQSDFAELEVYGHLRSIFYDKDVVQIDEQDGKKGKTPDFKVGKDLYVEVYCPDESHKEKYRVGKELEQQSGMVRTVLSRPVTGSEPLAVKYSTNQTIARVLGAKRNNDQTKTDARNVLWVDVKHKLKLSVKHLLPLESLNHSNQTYIGSFGVWHAFYGCEGESIFPSERYTLKFSTDSESDIYKQHQHSGLFRERTSLSAAVVSCLDGNVLFLNPWADKPTLDEEIRGFTTLGQFRPEYSYFVKNTLEADISSKEEMISFLVGKGE